MAASLYGLVGCALCVFSALAVFVVTDEWFGHVAWIWIPIFGLAALSGATLMLVSAFRTFKITKEIRARQRPAA